MQRAVPAWLAAIVAVSGLTQPAAAADLQELYAAPPPLRGSYNWTGLYVGGQGGYGGGTFDVSPRGSDIDGWYAGGQIGFNWQNIGSPWVIGVEVDAAAGDIERDVEYQSGWAFANAYSKVSSFGSARVRVGYAIDRALIYGTGGFAWAQSEVGFYANVNGFNAAASSSNTQTGFAVGAGFEWAMSRSWTMKLEYLYNDLGSANYLAGTIPGGIDADLRFSTGRLGINYIFDWGRPYLGPKY